VPFSTTREDDRVDAFSLSVSPRGSGWLDARLTCATLSGTEAVAEISASYMSDAPEDFLDAVLAMLYGASFAWVTWMLEPDFVRWQFGNSGNKHLYIGISAVNDADPWLSTQADPIVQEAVVGLVPFAHAAHSALTGFVEACSSGSRDVDWGKPVAPIQQRLDDLRATLDGGHQPIILDRLRADKPHGADGGWASALSLPQFENATRHRRELISRVLGRPPEGPARSVTQ